MKNIISIHHLDDYLFKIPMENAGNYTRIPGDKRRMYDKSVTEEMIDDDKHKKFIIDRETVKRKINFGKYTSY